MNAYCKSCEGKICEELSKAGSLFFRLLIASVAFGFTIKLQRSAGFK